MGYIAGHRAKKAILTVLENEAQGLTVQEILTRETRLLIGALDLYIDHLRIMRYVVLDAERWKLTDVGRRALHSKLKY